MAINRPDLLWSTYQEKQLKALESIEKNINKSTRLEVGFIEDISEIMEEHAKSLIVAIDDIWNDRFTTVDRYVPFIHKQSSRIADSSEESSELLEEIKEEQKDDNEKQQRQLKNLGDALRDLDIEGYVRKAIDSANVYSELYNTIITMTGANGQEAQALRRDMINQIQDLNDDIGNKLNPTEALQTMMAMSNNTNISNMETLKEITAPILLAQETMNISLSNIAELSGRMYTKYNFSSAKLERMVDTIRSSTKGQDVSEDLIVSAISNLEDNFAIYSEGDADLLEKLNDGLIKGVSFLEANYIDSQTYLNDLSDFLSPDARDQASMVKKYGSDYASQISSAAQSGDIDTALALQNEALSNMSIYEALARGFNRDDWMQANSDYKDLGVEALEEFKASMESNENARETTEDKFISIGDQINNNLNSLTSYLATIQETLGVGFTDLASIYLLFKNLKMSDQVMRGLQGAGLSMTGGATGAGLAGTLSAFGPALGIGAAAVGIAAVVNGLYEAYKLKNGIEEDNFDRTVDALGNIEDGMLPIWERIDSINPETGEVTTSYKLSQIESSATDLESALRDTSKVLENDLASLEEKYEPDNLWQGFQKTILGLGVTEGENGKRQWYDYIPFIGSHIEDTQKSSEMWGATNAGKLNEDLMAFYYGLDDTEKTLYNAYQKKNLLKTVDQIEFFMDNFDKFLELSEEGLASEVSKEGLKNPGSRMSILGYDKGTNYVNRDQLAYIHEGEAITPKEYNPAANLNELERLRASEDHSEELTEMLGTLVAIKELIESMNSANAKNQRLASGRNSVARSSVAQYALRY